MAGQDFRLIMISAMYENGGNTTQRLLDGNPELFSYPFESQPGTRYVQDHLTSLFPVKYRWPARLPATISGTVGQRPAPAPTGRVPPSPSSACATAPGFSATRSGSGVSRMGAPSRSSRSA